MTDEPTPAISVSTDQARHRVTIRAQGQWALADAQTWYGGMDRVRGWAGEARALMRMQCRRLLAALDHLYADDVEEAKRLLGWDRADRQAA